MKTLYIIGNGFDIAHGIHTPYISFRKFLETNHSDFLLRFEEIYNIVPLDPSDWRYTKDAQDQWDNNINKTLWAQFEENIGNPNVDSMYDEALSLTDGMPEYGVKDTLDQYWRSRYEFSNKFQEYVLNWIETVDTSQAKPLKKEFVDNNSDLFLSFNYTDTLERVYGIENVLHIHGGVSSVCHIPPLMGHGNQYLINETIKKARQYNNEGIEWCASIYEAIAKYVDSLHKPVDSIIYNNAEFFKSLVDVHQIVCIGISFGKVDIPYLNRIQDAIKDDTKWTIYYYDEEGYKHLQNVFKDTEISRKYEIDFRKSDDFWND